MTDNKVQSAALVVEALESLVEYVSVANKTLELALRGMDIGDELQENKDVIRDLQGTFRTLMPLLVTRKMQWEGFLFAREVGSRDQGM